MAIYEHPDNKGEAPGHIAASMLKTSITGVDVATTFILTFNKTLQAQAVLSCSITLPTPRPAGCVRFLNGNIVFQAPIYKPGAFTVEYFDKPGSGNVVNSETKEFNYTGGGWHFQADEVARCIRDGKLESSEWGHAKSLLVMKVFDEVRIWNILPGRCCVDCTPRSVVKADMNSQTGWSRLLDELRNVR